MVGNRRRRQDATKNSHRQLENTESAMSKTLKLKTFQIGAPPKRGEGLRLGVTRRPPRGIPRARWQLDGFFDVWLPSVAPSADLLRRAKDLDFDDVSARQRFFRAYEREMQATEARQTIALLAALAMRTPIAIGCHCGDESRCHRSILRQLIEDAVKKL